VASPRSRLRDIVGRLLGRSTYQQLPDSELLDLDSPEVERIRRQYGGQLAPPGTSQSRWYIGDMEPAEHQADAGNLTSVARLMRAARGDGVFAGVLSTCTDGLVRLPKKFRGDKELVKSLAQGNDPALSEFDEMLPPAELALLAADGRTIGVGVGELVPVEGRDFPVLVRLEPEFLSYRWSENRWYYRSVVGLLPITPGDGRWVLHVPGGRMAPWRNGIWRAIGRAYIRKDHAAFNKDNWESKLAHPARVAVSPTGAGEKHKQAWFRAVMRWGMNTVFGVTPGYDVKLLESNGRGADSFSSTISEQNQEMIITVAGQTVTTDGGAGFQNSDIHKTIRADIIKSIADGLSYTINTQVFPTYVACRYGEEAISSRVVCVEWDVTPPKDRNSEATSLQTLANAIKGLTEALAPSGKQPDVEVLCEHYSVPIKDLPPGTATNVVPLKPSIAPADKSEAA
jgi:hypothetical protein